MGMGRRLDRRNHGRCAVLDAPDSRRRLHVRLAACPDFGVDMVARGLLVAAVAVIGLAQTGDKVFTISHSEGAGKSDAVKATGMVADGDRSLLRQRSMPKTVARRSRHGSAHDWLPQVSALSVLAVADYHSTKRAFANVPSGREANPILSCGGQLCGQRYWALNGAVIASAYAINRFVAPKLPARSRRILSAATWAMIGVRGYVVAHNYRAGGAR